MNTDHVASVVEWNESRGFGFLVNGDERIFLHIRDFSERHRLPKKGDRVRFALGSDQRGRRCAKQAVQLGVAGRISIFSALALAALLILPALAVLASPFDWRWLAGYAVLISAITYAAYADDKRSARTRVWRVPEAELHFFELAGGWPGAFVAQRRLRHKCNKRSYQATFWLIVLLFQLVAFDFLADWKIASLIWDSFRDLAQLARDNQTLPR